MKKSIVVSAWIVATVAQLAVVACMINTQETILREGIAYRFRTAPVDPYDAFRGRYVAISLEPRTVAWPEGLAVPDRRGSFYVTLGADAEGYAVFTGAALERPEQGDYLRVKRGWRTDSNQVSVLHVVDRYYLPEDEAKRAEKIYAEHSRAGKRDAYVVLKVRKGEGLAEDLVIGGRPIREWMKDTPEGEPSR